MSNKPDGGPAFPAPNHYHRIDGAIVQCEGFSFGMSLRDHFAGLAMQGMVAGLFDGTYEKLAESAYKTADAMIAARTQDTKS